MRKVIPMPGFVLVKPKPETEGTIILPDLAQRNKNRAEVLAISKILPPNTTDLKLTPGDTIFVRDYVDKPLQDGDETAFFVEYADVLGVEENGKTV